MKIRPIKNPGSLENPRLVSQHSKGFLIIFLNIYVEFADSGPAADIIGIDF